MRNPDVVDTMATHRDMIREEVKLSSNPVSEPRMVIQWRILSRMVAHQGKRHSEAQREQYKVGERKQDQQYCDA